MDAEARQALETPAKFIAQSVSELAADNQNIITVKTSKDVQQKVRITTSVDEKNTHTRWTYSQPKVSVASFSYGKYGKSGPKANLTTITRVCSRKDEYSETTYLKQICWHLIFGEKLLYMAN